MAAILSICFTNSINMALIIILLALLMPLLKKYLSAVCIYRLWVIVLIGLLIPIRFDTNTALFYIGTPQISAEDKENPDIQTGNAYNHGLKQHNLEKQLTPDKQVQSTRQGSWNYFIKTIIAKVSNMVQNKYFFLCLIWGVTAIVLIAVKGIGYLVYRKRLKRFIRPVIKEDILKEYNRCIQELHSNCSMGLFPYNKISLYTCPVISCPISIGILKPAILLPDEAYTDKEIYFILKHELIHILRRDSLIKLIQLIVLAFNWYNPICYVMTRYLEEWCEASCDEQVLLNAVRTDRFGYGKLLLKYAEIKTYIPSAINLMGGNNMKNRLKSIIEHRKKHSGIVPVVLLLCIVFTMVIVSSRSHTDSLAAGITIADEKEPMMQQDETENRPEDKRESSLADNSGQINNEIIKKETEISDSNGANTLSAAVSGEDITEYARQAVGSPYLWGGDDLDTGVDASGFTQVIYRKFGYSLPRTSREQAEECTEVSMDSIQPGDLIFYPGAEENMADHVGIYIGEDKIIHAKNARDGVVIQDINYRTPISAGRVIS
jgi:cell wall-associated NlpC family hydrolase